MKKYNHIKYLQRQYGVTLIELLVAMVISMIVLLGVVTVYVSSKRSYQFQETIVELQENARYAFTQFTSNARSAGYLGCNPSIKNLLNNTAPGYNPGQFNLQSGISGWEANGTGPGSAIVLPAVPVVGGGGWTPNPINGIVPPLDALIAGQTVQGTDVLILSSARPLENLIPNPAPETADTFTVNVPHGVPKGAIVIISDCTKGDMFQTNDNAPLSVTFNRPIIAAPVGSPDSSPGNLDPATNNFSQPITSLARIQVVRSTAFFIGLSPNGEPSLFRADYGAGVANVVELAQGVEQMQILYGEDLTAPNGPQPDDGIFAPNRYVTADNIIEPDNVISIRISLLTRTSDALNRTAGTTNQLLGTTAATGTSITSPLDSRARRVFSSTIFMRNKALFRDRIGD